MLIYLIILAISFAYRSKLIIVSSSGSYLMEARVDLLPNFCLAGDSPTRDNEKILEIKLLIFVKQ